MVLLGHQRGAKRLAASLCAVACVSFLGVPMAYADTTLSVPISRSSLVVLPSPMKELMIANPDIADVHAHNSTTLTVVGKHVGHTNVRVFDASGKLLRTFEVSVGYDLPAIRKSLKTFLPDETVGVEMVNTSVALTGQVRSGASAEKAVKIVRDFLGGSASNDFGTATAGGTSSSSSSGGTAAAAAAVGGEANPEIMNLLKVTSGQQVMLRVRVGEVSRDAIKRLGVDPAIAVSSPNLFTNIAFGTQIPVIAAGAVGSTAVTGADAVTVPDGQFHGAGALGWKNGGDDRVSGVIKALERDGLFKLLAEPNLVALSGEQAEFLAGGEIPIPVTQSSGGSGAPTTTIEYKPFGVSVKFTPDVLGENRIRIQVQPEVSEISAANGVTLNGATVPSISTRRAKTTVELAPGESFMIAGLIKDRSQATIDQLPGVKDLPVLGALFRSTDFQRNETELVIAVTPYLVDPMKSSDVKLPTDNFTPASQAEMFFFGALGALAGNGQTVSQTLGLEGPTGFMVD